MNNVLTNNNKQVIINQLYNERINNITKITNSILNEIKKDNQLANDIQYKLKLIKEELVNIRYAIHWAKQGIINSMILSNKEIRIAMKTLNEENVPYATSEEALDFANIKIISNGSYLFYIINIPLTTEKIYDKLLLKAVKKRHIINEIPYDVIIKNKNDMYGIIDNCKTTNSLSICNRNNIVNLKNSSCIPNLLNSLNSTCNKINNQHINTIDEISEGIILLNQFKGTINIEDVPYKLNGTFLLKFHNTTVHINERNFISKEIPTFQILPPILQPTPNEKEHREFLSLEMMKEIQIENTDQINLVRSENDVHRLINYSLTTLILISIVITISIKLFKNRKPTNKEVKTDPIENTKEEAQIEEQITIENPSPLKKKKKKFYDTTFF